MSERDFRGDPLGDNDELVVTALRELYYVLPLDSQRTSLVQRIDDLIQARIVMALESLTEATEVALGDPKSTP